MQQGPNENQKTFFERCREAYDRAQAEAAQRAQQLAQTASQYTAPVAEYVAPYAQPVRNFLNHRRNRLATGAATGLGLTALFAPQASLPLLALYGAVGAVEGAALVEGSFAVADSATGGIKRARDGQHGPAQAPVQAPDAEMQAPGSKRRKKKNSTDVKQGVEVPAQPQVDAMEVTAAPAITPARRIVKAKRSTAASSSSTSSSKRKSACKK